ncbi:hypothetical protein THOM_1126, partial [Trachipleistophora hominis]
VINNVMITMNETLERNNQGGTLRMECFIASYPLLRYVLGCCVERGVSKERINVKDGMNNIIIIRKDYNVMY